MPQVGQPKQRFSSLISPKVDEEPGCLGIRALSLWREILATKSRFACWGVGQTVTGKAKTMARPHKNLFRGDEAICYNCGGSLRRSGGH